jgi:type IV secretion system protein VirB10
MQKEENHSGETSQAEKQRAPSASLRDKRSLPEGVVPRQAQSYLIAGLAVLILLAVMFSKNHARATVKEVPASTLTVSNDMNRRKIQELEQDLTSDQRQSQQAEKAVNPATVPANNGSGFPAQAGAVANPVAPVTPMPPSTTETQRDPVADAEHELAFRSRFASNLIGGEEAQSTVPSLAFSPTTTDRSDARLSPTVPYPQEASKTPELEQKKAPEVNLNSAQGQPYVIFQGTTVDTVLANRLEGEFAGPIKVMVTNPVYSQDRQHVLIPEGTFILGEVQKVAGFGQRRLAVTFHRLLMPDGYSVDLDQFHGLDQVGATGLKDQVNNHYLEIFGTSIALGVISGVAEITNNTSGLNETGSEAYKSGAASSLSQSSNSVLDRFLSVPPTITIREGHRIKVYLSQDILLPAYENHTVPGNL